MERSKSPRNRFRSPGWNKPEGYSNLRTNGADTWAVHHKGADAVTELALTIARAAELATEHEKFQYVCRISSSFDLQSTHISF